MLENLLEQGYIENQMKINRFDPKNFNLENFEKKYEIKKIIDTSGKEYGAFKSEIFPKLENNKDILSIRYDNGKKIYILIKRDGNYIDWNEILPKNYRCESYRELKNKDVYFNLLLNALGRHSSKKANLNGNLYYFIDVFEDVYTTLNFKIKNSTIILRQQKFSRYDPENKKHEKIPKYKIFFASNNSIHIERCYKIKKDDKVYVERAKGKPTIDISFDNLNLNRNKDSKIDALHEIVKAFNSNYSDIARLEFPIHNIYTKILTRRSEYFQTKLKELSKNIKKVNVCTLVNNTTIKEKRKKFIELIKKNIIDVTENNYIEEKVYNICIYHNKDYYKKHGLEDPYKKIPKNIIKQGITIKNLNKSNIVTVVLSELFIKSEIKNRKIDRWNYGNYEFYFKIKNKEKFYYCHLNIDENGKFEFTTNRDEIDDEFTKYNEKSNIYLIKNGDNIKEIYHTDYIPIIDIQALEKCEAESRKKDSPIFKGQKQTTRSKGKEYRKDKLLYSYLDKNVFENSNKNTIYYDIGDPYDTLNRQKKTVGNIYGIKNPDDEEFNLEDKKIIIDILNMLNDYYVRATHFESVRPYPFKYMIEYLREITGNTDLYLGV